MLPMVLAVTYMLAEKSGAVIPPEDIDQAHQPVLYDFRRPTTLSREHARTLELGFETFARQWGTQITARVRVMSQVKLEAVEMHTYDDYIARLPATTVMMLCQVEGAQQRGVVQFPASGALNWVSHVLGSPGTTRAPERKFTRIEQTLVRQLISEALEDLHYSLGGLITGSVTVDAIHYNAQFAQAAAASDLMICASFTIRVGEAAIAATLALPADAILPQLGDGSAPESGEHDAEYLRGHLANVPMDLALVVSETKVTPDEILRLTEGDVIKLDHIAGRPLLLSADGQQIGTAAAGTRSGRIAAVVVTTEESV